VDCILEDTRSESSQKGTAVIVDFKTKYKLKISDYTGENGLTDFQLPLYLRLTEDVMKKETDTSLFFSIVDASPQVLTGFIQNSISGETIPKKADNWITKESEEFKYIMSQFDEKVKVFAMEISGENFSFPPVNTQACPSCKHKKVCRTMYKIHQEKNYG
jgi:hypothetical protein